MDWTLIIVFANVVLNVVILGFWKPWLGAYGGEKAKNIARKEDLNVILAEVRAVTITQQTIEAKLSGDLWDRQMRWNQKKDIYADLLSFTTACANNYKLAAHCSLLAAENPAFQIRYHEERSKAITKVNKALAGLTRAFSLARLFTSENCVTAIDEFSSTPHRDVYTCAGANQAAAAVTKLSDELVAAGKKELGIPL